MTDKSNQVLQQTSELPSSIKTLFRAKILFQLKRIQPSNRLHLISLGYTKGTISKTLREFVNDGVAEERFHLYRLTDYGNKILEKIRDDPLVRHWLSTKNLFKINENLRRPKIIKLD